MDLLSCYDYNIHCYDYDIHCSIMALFNVAMKSSLVYRNSVLTLSRWWSLLYRNQSTDLLSKSVDWFLHNQALPLERIKRVAEKYSIVFNTSITQVVRALQYRSCPQKICFSMRRTRNILSEAAFHRCFRELMSKNSHKFPRRTLVLKFFLVILQYVGSVNTVLGISEAEILRF